MTNESNETLVGHLTELRTRIMYSLIGIICGCMVAWIFSDQIFNIIRGPIEPYLQTEHGGLVYTGVMDKFMAHIKVSLLAGFVGTCPFWLYHLWHFIAPGLYKEERRYGLAFIFAGTFLFLLGVSFVYFVVYPMAFKFLMTFGGDIDQAMITIGEYLSFFATTTIVFGLMFELPLILTILGIAGIIDADFLKRMRRYAIVILAALAAIVTPPDIVSMFLMMGPLILLYESSIILVKMFGTKPPSVDDGVEEVVSDD